MQRLRAKLTYANVVSTLCLFLLLGGGAAIAATQLPKGSVGPKQLQAGAVTNAKIKAGTISEGKLSKQTVTALRGATGPQGPPGLPGPKGETGMAGGAPAYARIEIGGGVDPDRSRNVSSTNVSHPAKGVYCFNNLPFTPTNAVASPQYYEPQPVTIAVFLGAYEQCPANTQVSVKEMQADNMARDSPFMILFN